MERTDGELVQTNGDNTREIREYKVPFMGKERSVFIAWTCDPATGWYENEEVDAEAEIKHVRSFSRPRSGIEAFDDADRDDDFGEDYCGEQEDRPRQRGGINPLQLMMFGTALCAAPFALGILAIGLPFAAAFGPGRHAFDRKYGIRGGR